MTTESLKAIIAQKQNPDYVAPANDFVLGREALRKGLLPEATWTERMRAGWDFEGQRCYALAMTEGA